MFLLLPVYTAYLSPANFGVLNVVMSLSSILSIFILMSLNAAATRFYYLNTSEDYAKELWGTLVTIILLNSLFIGGVVLLFHRYLVDPFIGKIPFFPFVFLGILNVILSPLFLFFQSYLQAIQDGVKYSVYTISFFLIQVSLTLYSLIVLKLGVEGLLLANVITSAIFFVYVVFTFLPKIKLGFRKDILSESFKYSIPLLPHSLAAWSSGMVDKLLLNGLANQRETGLYSAGLQFGGIVALVEGAVNKAFVPWFFQKESEGEEGRRKIENAGELFILSFSFLALILSLFAKEILFVMVDSKYRSISNIIPIIAFTNVFNGIYYLHVNVLFIKNTNRVFLITVFGAVVNIFTNLILIPKIGLYGAVVAHFLTMLSISLLAVIISKRLNKDIKYKTKKMYFFVVLFFLISLSSNIFEGFPVLLSILLKAVICLITLFIIYSFYKKIIFQVFTKLKK